MPQSSDSTLKNSAPSTSASARQESSVSDKKSPRSILMIQTISRSKRTSQKAGPPKFAWKERMNSSSGPSKTMSTSILWLTQSSHRNHLWKSLRSLPIPRWRPPDTQISMISSNTPRPSRIRNRRSTTISKKLWTKWATRSSSDSSTTCNCSESTSSMTRVPWRTFRRPTLQMLRRLPRLWRTPRMSTKDSRKL